MSDLAVALISEAANRTPSLMMFLVAEARHLPDDPAYAREAVRQRWPDMTDEERDMAFMLAGNVLRRIGADCIENANRLDLLSNVAGRA
jgi:hypothetical protein